MGRFIIFAAFWVWLTWHPVFAEREAADEANRIGVDSAEEGIPPGLEHVDFHGCPDGWTCQPEIKAKDPEGILKEYLAMAAETQVRLHEYLSGVLTEMPEGGVLQGEPKGTKSEASYIRKINYATRIRTVVDVSRASLIFKSEEDARAAVQFLEEDKKNPDFEVVRVNDRFAKPMPIGHRDMQLNLRDKKNGFLVEVEVHQVHLKHYHDNRGHAIYEKYREIMKGRPMSELSDGEKTQIEGLLEKSVPEYKKAYEMSGGSAPPSEWGDRPF